MWRLACLVLLCLLAVPTVAYAVSTPAPQQPSVPADMVISRISNPMLKIDVHYPALGNPMIDDDLKEWATQLADNFENEFAEENTETRVPYELSTTYTLLRPANDTTVTVVWEVASYTQGAHGNLDIVTSIYTLPNGDPLSINDLFADLGTALNLLSERSYAQLSTTLGDLLDEDMLRGGTSPDPDNFSSVALIPGALRVFFQPYQVAPWVAGSQSVDIPLQDLEDAGPRLALWGLQELPKPVEPEPEPAPASAAE